MTQKEYLKTVGNKIRKARIARGLTVLKLCYLCDLTPSAMSGIQCGKYNTGIYTLKRIAEALGLEAKDLI